MIFHENRLLADDSHDISYLIFEGKMLQNMSSAAVMSCALRVKASIMTKVTVKPVLSGHSKKKQRILMTNSSLMKVKQYALSNNWS